MPERQKECVNMELQWKGRHRSLIEKMIRYGNAYAYTFRKQRSFGTDTSFSASQIQTLEYILEAEDSDEKMTEMAARLGVSKATFSKNVKSLVDKGLLEKFHCEGNQKNIYVKPTTRGREVYQEYTKFICENLFDKILDMANQVPQEYLKVMEDMLDYFAERLVYYQDDQNDQPQEKVFIKIE